MQLHNGFFNAGVKDNDQLIIHKKFIKHEVLGKDVKPVLGKDGKPKVHVDTWGYFSVAISGTEEECDDGEDPNDEPDDYDEFNAYYASY